MKANFVRRVCVPRLGHRKDGHMVVAKSIPASRRSAFSALAIRGIVCSFKVRSTQKEQISRFLVCYTVGDLEIGKQG